MFRKLYPAVMAALDEISLWPGDTCKYVTQDSAGVPVDILRKIIHLQQSNVIPEIVDGQWISSGSRSSAYIVGGTNYLT